jgi:hypothetical protein
MLERIITGGQTGADQAGWRVAQAFGIRTGGGRPRGFLTEEGPRPALISGPGRPKGRLPPWRAGLRSHADAAIGAPAGRPAGHSPPNPERPGTPS